MLLLRVLCAAALFTFALASISNDDFMRIIAGTPACAMNCSLTVLPAAHCPLAEMDTCLCKDDDLQKTLATCVIKSCSVPDQNAATLVRQDLICDGIPTASRTHEIETLFIILAVITYPIVILRFISRCVIARRIWWDDWTILVATIFLIPMTVLPFLQTSEGFGRHFWDVTPDRIIPLRKTYYAVQMIYCIVLTLAKLSILFLYLRIFLDKTFRRIIVVAMIVLCCHGVIYLFCIAFQCVPVSVIWTMGPGKCLNLQAMIFSGAGLSIFEDVFIMILPFWELKKLALSSRRKVALVFMFALGSFASITSMIRLRYIAKFGNSVDVTWDNIDVVIWSDIEIFTAVICASIICVRPLIAKFFSSATKSVSDALGISHVVETLPMSNKSTKVSHRWSEAFSSKMPASRNSGHMKLPESSTHDSNSMTNVEEGGSIADANDKPVKVWITKGATVERGSIHMDDINMSPEHSTTEFRGRTVVEVSPPVLSADIEARAEKIRNSSQSPKREPEG